MSERLRKDGHETMKNSKFFILLAVGLLLAIIFGCIVFLTPNVKKDNDVTMDSSEESYTENNLSYSEDVESADSSEESSIDDEQSTADITEDDNSAETTEKPDKPVEEDTPTADGGSVADVNDKTPPEKEPVPTDSVTSGTKDDNATQTGPTSGEDRIDEIIEEKEEHVSKPTEDDDKPVIIEDEKTSTDVGDKGDAELRDEETNVDDDNKNAPVYKPSVGGDNPFDDDTKTEINDTPVEDYISEGEDRPGEGIHF